MNAEKIKTKGLLVAACVVLLAAPVFAQTADSGIPVISGGVGEVELDGLKSVERDYNLKVLLTDTDGVFLAYVPVQIADASGQTVLSVVSEGPIVLTTLPAGTYKVTATQGDEVKEQKVTVKAKGLREAHIRFSPAPDTVSEKSDTRKAL